MGSVNKAILIGNLGRDAEMRFTAGGTPVATVSLATTEKYKDRDGNAKENTQWHRIVIWGKTAEALQEYLVKGKQIYVEGSIETKEWTDKEGKKVKSTEIKANRVVLLGGGGGGNGGARRQRSESDDSDAPYDAGSAPSDDDIPFSVLVPLLLPLAWPWLARMAG